MASPVPNKLPPNWPKTPFFTAKCGYREQYNPSIVLFTTHSTVPRMRQLIAYATTSLRPRERFASAKPRKASAIRKAGSPFAGNGGHVLLERGFHLW